MNQVLRLGVPSFGVQRVVFDWLRSLPEQIPGERCLVDSWNDMAYLGVFDPTGHQFVHRYHVENGELKESSLEDPPNAAEVLFGHACASFIKTLRSSGTLESRRCPKYYNEGTAALYKLVPDKMA